MLLDKTPIIRQGVRARGVLLIIEHPRYSGVDGLKFVGLSGFGFCNAFNIFFYFKPLYGEIVPFCEFSHSKPGVEKI